MALSGAKVVEEIRALVERKLQQTLDIFWLAYDGIHRVFVDRDPVYARWR